MASCFSIEILEDIQGLPSYMQDGSSGGVFIELANDSSVSLEETREELNDINEIRIDSILDITVPQTPKNDIIFGSWFKNGVLDRDYDPLCSVLKIGSIPTKQRFVYPVSKNDKNCTYDLKVTWSKEHWATALSECNLCEAQLDFNEFELTLDNVIAGWGSDAWQDGDPIYQWVPFYLGEESMSDPNALNISDFRPVYNLLGLTKALFKKSGWCFESPLLECEEFRCLWTYESGEFFRSNVNLDTLKFKSRLNGSVDANTFDDNQLGTFTNLVLDTPYILDNFYSDVGFQHNGVFEFKVSGTVTSGQVEIEIVKVCNNSFTVIGRESVQATGTETISINTGEVTLSEDCRVFVRYSSPSGANLDICFWNCPISANFQDGDIVLMSTLLDCDVSALDRFKGILHLINGKLDIDCTTKKVIVKPAFNVKCNDGTIIEGFNKNETVDISEYIICNSLITSTPSFDAERFCLYGFKKSNDEAIEAVSEQDIVDGGEQVFDYVSDFGKSYRDKTKVNRNPYYEPLINVELGQYGSDAPIHLGSLQNDSPRVFYMKTGTQYYIDPINGGIGTQLLYGQGVLNDTPNVFTDFDYENFGIFNFGANQPSHLNISYEENFKYYKREEFQRQGANNVSIDVCLDMVIFRNLYFDKRVYFYYEGCSYSLILDSKTFNPCDFTGVLIGSQERKTLSCSDDLIDDDNGDITTGEDCENNPDISCEKVGNCYQLGITGVESPVASTIWEYRLCDPDTAWQTGGLITSTGVDTAEICDIPRTAKIRVQVLFDDGCPALYAPIKTIDGCLNEPEYIWDCYINSEGLTCFKISLGGQTESPIDTHNYELLIAGILTPYTLGDEYCFDASLAGQEITAQINGVMTFSDACDPINDLSSTKTFPPETIKCELTNAIAECIEVDPGCFTFKHTGNFATNTAWVGYKIICDNEEDYWTNADDPFKCSTDFEVYLVAVFCSVCPIYCQPTPTVCEVDVDCPTGTAELTCDSCILTVNISGYLGYVFELFDPNGNSMGVVTDGMTFNINSPNHPTNAGVGIEGIYNLIGNYANCIEVTDDFNHQIPYAGQSGSTDL